MSERKREREREGHKEKDEVKRTKTVKMKSTLSTNNFYFVIRINSDCKDPSQARV